jgi:hypothetical protein
LSDVDRPHRKGPIKEPSAIARAIGPLPVATLLSAKHAKVRLDPVLALKNGFGQSKRVTAGDLVLRSTHAFRASQSS